MVPWPHLPSGYRYLGRQCACRAELHCRIRAASTAVPHDIDALCHTDPGQSVRVYPSCARLGQLAKLRQLHGVPEVGRHHLCPEAQERRPQGLAGNVFSKLAAVHNS